MTRRKQSILDKISLTSQGSRKQFDIALAVITIIPALVLVTLLRMDKLREAMGVTSYILLVAGLILLMSMGYIMLSRYPATIVKLRKHLEKIAQGELPSTIELFRDENDIRAIEEGMNLVLDRLRSKVKNVENENTELQKQLFQTRKLEAVGTLATGIAHEVSTPLQYISDNVTFLSRCVEECFQCINEHAITSSSSHSEEDLTFLKDELPACIKQTREGIERIATIIKALKEYARKGSDDAKSPADMNAAIQNVVAVCRNEWKRLAEMNLDLSSDLKPILCYPGEIKQSIMSLLTNATSAIKKRKESEPNLKGRLAISTTTGDGRLIITVSDNGCGIAEEHQHRIFDPFFSTRDIGQGVGQGLSTTFFSVVRRHNGSISFRSKPNEGSEFIISIPTIEPEETPE